MRFLSRVYLWRQGLYQPLQFVLAEYSGKQIILAGTDLELAAEDMLIMSEASMMAYLLRDLFRFLATKDNLTITKSISSSQIPLNEAESDRLIG